MADSDPPGLTPEELQRWHSTQPSAAPMTPPPPPGLTPEETRRFYGPEDTPGSLSGASDPSVTGAFWPSARQGVASVVNSPSAWFGGNPLMDPSLSPEEQAAVNKNWLAGRVGHITGQVAATAPALLAADYFGPSALIARGAMGIPGLIARGVGIGTAAGGLQGLFSSGENFEPGAPQEGTWPRVRKGMEWGAATGPVSGVADWAAGAGRTITPETQAAANALRDDMGIDITSANLPRTGAKSQLGEPATEAQRGQINRAWGTILGEDIPNFSQATVNRVEPKLGNDVDATWRAGHIDFNATPPAGGDSLETALNKIETAASPSAQARVRSLLGDIRATVGSGGRIEGNAVGDLLRNDSQLNRATNSPIADVADAATQIKRAVTTAFENSSPADVAAASRLAREKYKLWIAGKESADSVTGNIDPKALVRKMGNMYGDFDKLGGGPTITDGAANFTRNVGRIFGGSSGSSRVPQEAATWLGSLGTSAAGLFGLPHLIPAVADNPLLAGAAATIPLGIKGGEALGRAYQGSGMYTRNLLTRGARAVKPYIPTLFGAGGGAYGNPGTPQ